MSAAERGVPWTVDAEGVTLAVRVTPRASRTEVHGVRLEADGRPVLTIRVASPPVDGEANAALIAFLAKRLGVGRSAISLASGATGRTKIIRVGGDAEALADRLAALLT